MEAYFKNCVEVRTADGWYAPMRLTQTQIQSFCRTEPKRRLAVSTAGISLAFATAATQVSFDYKFAERNRDWAYFDIVIDGLLQQTHNSIDENGTVTVALPGGSTHTVEIFLPHILPTLLRNLRMNAPATPLPPREKLCLFLGDSITQGMHAKHPAMTYVQLLSRKMGWDFINMGVGGGTFFETDLDRIERTPDYILVAFGTNDWMSAESGDEIAANAKRYLDKLTRLYDCKNICGILPIWRSDEQLIKAGVTFAQAREIIKEAYMQYPSIRLIDGYRLIPPLEEFYEGAENRTRQQNDAGFLCYEGSRIVHPNEMGFLHCASALESALKLHFKL